VDVCSVNDVQMYAVVVVRGVAAVVVAVVIPGLVTVVIVLYEL
jgi:hypothetical protein